MTAMHTPVLLTEAIKALITSPNGIYIDGTYGRGGHTSAILTALSNQGRLIAIDKDLAAVQDAKEKFGTDPRFIIKHGSFAMLREITDNAQVTGQIQGILFDLGVSSPQFDEASRGFSFSKEGPLDMRMDQTQPLNAKDWVNHATESELKQVIQTYGEERFAHRIARAIVHARQLSPITTTHQLASVVAKAHPAWEVGQHPATRTFQAIRIFINHELGDLETGLQQSLDVLSPGGRLVVISFHSLEDRIVKRFIRRESTHTDDLPKEIPIVTTKHPRLNSIGRKIKPSHKEITANPRSRSAVMRVAEKVS